MDSRTINICSPIHASITPPGSKSITNRALAMAAVAEGDSILRGALDCDDTHRMMDSLRNLGVALEHDTQNAVIRVRGNGGNFRVSSEGTTNLFCGNSGTTLRFLTAICANATGTIRLDGVERMRERPLGDLIAGLRQLGVSLECEFGNDCPPILIHAHKIPGGTAVIPGSISSQFLSGLLMAAPLALHETTLSVSGPLVSRPYIDMTLAVMRSFGAKVTETTPNTFQIPANQHCTAADYTIEPDASAASYFFAAAAVAGGEITVRNLTRNALQGDVKFCDCLEKMGCTVEYFSDSIRVSRPPETVLHGVDVDMHSISDTAQTLSVAALFADSPTTIRNVANMRVKETDRIRAVVTELRKFGVNVTEFEDGMTIHPLKESKNPVPTCIEVETYNDHRMAMSFAIAGLRLPGITILNAECTAKTYPCFFEDLERVTSI